MTSKFEARLCFSVGLLTLLCHQPGGPVPRKHLLPLMMRHVCIARGLSAASTRIGPYSDHIRHRMTGTHEEVTPYF